MHKHDRGYTETQARPDTFDREESYGKQKRTHLLDPEELTPTESTKDNMKFKRGSYV